MGPSMSSVPPPGAHGGCSSFGVSEVSMSHRVQWLAPHISITNPGQAVLSFLKLTVPQLLGQFVETVFSLKQLSSMFLFPFSAVHMGLRGSFGLLCSRRAASPLL